MQVLESLATLGVPIKHNVPVVEIVVADFAEALHNRPKEAGLFGGGVKYSMFFRTFSPEAAAQSYLAKHVQP
jgi:hypothetical protein